MKKLQAQAMPAASAALRHAPAARLLGRDDIRRMAQERPDLAAALGDWCLCTEVPDQVGHFLATSGVAGTRHELLMFKAASGRSYLTFVLQAGPWQHRICVPLAGHVTMNWVRATAIAGEIQILAGYRDRMVLTGVTVPTEVKGWFESSEVDAHAGFDAADLVSEVRGVLTWHSVMARFEQDAEIQVIQELSQSVLFPAELDAMIERESQGARAASLN